MGEGRRREEEGEREERGRREEVGKRRERGGSRGRIQNGGGGVDECGVEIQKRKECETTEISDLLPFMRSRMKQSLSVV